MSEEEDDDITISSISDVEDEMKDVELMNDILQSIQTLRALPPGSDLAFEESATTDDVKETPINFDNLSLLELNIILDQISQGIDYNNLLQSSLLMKEVKLLSIKRQLQAFQSQNPGVKDEKFDESKGDSRKYIVKFKAPYFKNHQHFSSYTIVPEKALPFSAAKYDNKSLQWTKLDLKVLENAIKTFLSRRSVQNMVKTKKNETPLEKENLVNSYARLKKAPLKSLITDDFDEIIDWCQLASSLKKNYSPSECQKAWDIFMKPSINKKKWSKEELAKLKKCALERNFEDWDAVAQDLGTSRSGYQCFHEYVDALMTVQEGEWSKIEEEFLIKLVKDCTYGDRVLWHKISYYFETRSLAQIYRKWSSSAVGKNNKAGRFTEQEDQTIIDSLIMDSGNLSRVARHLNRLPSQVRYRCAQLKSSLQNHYGEWRLEEDKLLTELVDKYGIKKWAQIAEHIPSRSRVQIRHRYEHLRKKLASNPGKKIDELRRPTRHNHKCRKQSIIKYLLDKKTGKAAGTGEDDDPDDPIEEDNAVIGFDTAFGKIVLHKEDVEGVVMKEGKYINKRNEFSVKASTSAIAKRKTKKTRGKCKKASKPPCDFSTNVLDYYSFISEYIGDPVKPSEVCYAELEETTTNALFKFRPYKYFNKEIADWWYIADRSDPYYKEAVNYVERKQKDESEMKEGANWLFPPCVTSFEGFYNLLVDIGYKPSDLDKSEEEIEGELKELYCVSDDETIAAVARWKERLKTLFLWPAALSEIELDANEGEVGVEETPGCSQVLNESEIIQLAEELNQIEDDDLRAVMVRQLGLMEESNTDKENTKRLSLVVQQDDDVEIKTEDLRVPETSTGDVGSEIERPELDSADIQQVASAVRSLKV